MNFFNLGILLTRQCNQHCYYCDNYNINSKFAYIDIDYLEWILEKYASVVSKMHIELSGGEPGIITNIEQVFHLLMRKSYIHKVTVLSNGMIRKLNYNLKDIFKDKFREYIEHFCLEIQDKNIKFFYPELPFYDIREDWVSFVLVLSKTTLNSLLNNLDYFVPMYKLPICWKSITPKTSYPTEEYLNKLDKFYNYLSNIHVYKTDRLLLEKGKLVLSPTMYKTCAKISINQFLDLENKKIGMCSMQVSQSTTYDITETNIVKAINGSLFTANTFCENCYKFNRNCLVDMYNRKFFKKYKNIG